MDQNLRVDPADLHHAGHQIGGWHVDTHDSFTTAHAGIASSVASGWIGSSAEAMSARLASMRTAGTAITSNLNSHSEHMASSATNYETTDDHGVEMLQSIAKPVTPSEGLLDL